MIRKRTIAFIAAFGLAACSSETTAPAGDIVIDESISGTALTLNGGYDAVLYQDRLINALPDDLKLTDEQKTKIRALVDAFQASTKSDRDALAAIVAEARKAVRDGKGRGEVRRILERADPIRDRLAAAERKLMADIDAILTPEQRAWIHDHKPQRCRPDRFPPLSEAQKAQIHALEQAFRDQNKSDLDSLKTILDEARAAAEAGKSRTEIAAILAKGAPIAVKLAAARAQLVADIRKVLTPEQIASGCLPLG
jgi:Spy/CpxP family protein refolding chaperone